MVYAYLRYSTGRQNEAEQEVIIQRYCESHNIKVDEKVFDRAVSGATSWEDRNLAELISRISPGDTIICSEASRISRSMSDFSTFLNNGLKNLRARLIICNIGMDIDCSHLNAMVEIQLQMLLFAAQFERELIVQRVNAALDHRRELVKTQGGWKSKSGNWCTGLGPQNQYIAKKGAAVSARNRKMQSLRVDEDVIKVIMEMREDHIAFDQIANALNNMDFKTASGRKYYGMTVQRLLKAYKELNEA